MCSLNLQYVCTSDNLFSISLDLVVVVVVKNLRAKDFRHSVKICAKSGASNVHICCFVRKYSEMDVEIRVTRFLKSRIIECGICGDGFNWNHVAVRRHM